MTDTNDIAATIATLSSEIGELQQQLKDEEAAEARARANAERIRREIAARNGEVNRQVRSLRGGEGA